MTVIVLVTHPEQNVETFAAALIERKLAACINILPGVKSIYRWEGKVESSQEQLLLIKTESNRLQELERAVIAAHPYEVPEFVVLSSEYVSSKYQAWLSDCVCD